MRGGRLDRLADKMDAITPILGNSWRQSSLCVQIREFFVRGQPIGRDYERILQELRQGEVNDVPLQDDSAAR